MFLTKYELVELTGYGDRENQVKTLNQMGIIHKRNGKGEILVHEDHIKLEFGAVKGKERKPTTPNLNLYGAS